MATITDRLRNLRKEPKDKELEDVKNHTTKIWEYLRESRRRRSYENFINDQFYNNNQYLKYNVASRRVQSIPTQSLMDRITINKTYQQVRGIVNFLNADHPYLQFRPGDQADDAYLRAKKETHLWDYWYDHLEMNKKHKRISRQGTKYGVGWAKILWDMDALAPTRPFTMPSGDERTYMYGEVMFEPVDWFEMYVDPLATDLTDMRYSIHAPVRTLAELQNNLLYMNTDKISSDRKLAADNMKAFELRQDISSGAEFGFGQKHGMDTIVTLENHWRYFDTFSNKWKMRVTTRTEAGIILRNEDWAMNDYPYEYFQTDVADRIEESKGVIHNIREPNRALNEIVSQIHESARIMGKLNWRIPRGSNVDVITDEAGQFIEYDIVPGGAPEQTNAVNLPAYIMQEVNMLVGFMEDIGGMHASFNGKAPFAQASGDLVDSLSAGDQNNLTTMRDNFNDFVARSAKKMIATAKLNATSTRTVPSTQPDVFGQYKWMEIKPSDMSTSDDVIANTGSAMPYSIADKQQMYMNLWKEKVITDSGALLKALELPELDNALGDSEQDIQRQLDEIVEIMALKPNEPAPPNLTPLISEDHAVHIQTLDKFVKGDTFKSLPRETQQKIMDHRGEHIQLSIQLAQIQQAQQVDVIKRSETLMIRPTSLNEVTPIERTQFFNKFGIQSDAGQIQLRGGLYVQDPAQAEMQAQNEDVEMLQMRAVQIGLGDNHQVHIETHSQVMSHPNFTLFPLVVQQLFQAHVKDHVTAMQNILSAPGLVPNDQVGMPNSPRVQLPGQSSGPPEPQPKPGQNPNFQPGKNAQQSTATASAPPPKKATEEVTPMTKGEKPIASPKKVVQSKSKTKSKPKEA